MKRTVLFAAVIMMLSVCSLHSQIITPVIKANFGVEADLKRNFFTGSQLMGNDDWFPDSTSNPGTFIIDTSGAAAIMQSYIVDPNNRKTCFVRNMYYPIYTVVNGRFYYDAIFVRDHYKNDSTSFVTSNKNGDSPAVWNGGTTPVPDKSDLNDVMVHVRRDGPNLSDSLWLFAGISLHGNNGNRYFDLELYQSDINYNMADGKFYNYGPDAGHTTWKFDSVGNVISPGDVIFSAEFGSSSLTLLEARIWVDKNSLSLTPIPFKWGGLFDGAGAGAQFGYASILPKAAGDFYSGTQCTANTWAGPFGFVDINDIFNVNYLERQYMEIGVNMTKIGLDPYYLLGSNGCLLSFRRFIAKTRSSTSFTSSLKDFVGPYVIARPNPALAVSDSAMFCGTQPDTSIISVQNPVSSSTYVWTTLDGNILSSPAKGTSIMVDKVGTYIVTQYLFEGCSAYSVDTITLRRDSAGCLILSSSIIDFAGRQESGSALLHWNSTDKEIVTFDVERSTDRRSYTKISTLNAISTEIGTQSYDFKDKLNGINARTIYYRLKFHKTGSSGYSKVIGIRNNNLAGDNFTIVPNPAKNYMQIMAGQSTSSKVTVRIFNNIGNELIRVTLNSENERIALDKLPPGVYFVSVVSEDGQQRTQKKLVVAK